MLQLVRDQAGSETRKVAECFFFGIIQETTLVHCHCTRVSRKAEYLMTVFTVVCRKKYSNRFANKQRKLVELRRRQSKLHGLSHNSKFNSHYEFIPPKFGQVLRK